MITKPYNKDFFSGLQTLGFESEINENLLFVSEIDKYSSFPDIWFSLEKATIFKATAVYFKKTVGTKLTPQVYLYDFSQDSFSLSELTQIHKQIWTSGEIPIVCAFYKEEIKILDCTAPIDLKKDEPTYLAESIKLIGEVHDVFNQHFALNIRSGIFWDDEAFQKRFEFKKSAYDKLIGYLKFVINNFVVKSKVPDYSAQKLIIQSILVKYLEERVDSFGNGVFPPDYFKKYNNADSFCDVLRNGSCFKLFEDLNKNHFNGKIFEWSAAEIASMQNCDLIELANALDGRHLQGGQLSFDFWRQYEFNYIPVELISRLYEEFLGYGKKGLVYTPPHLARLLVEETMPLAKPKNTELFTLIDPACGSGIFLVVAFKRLVQWWRINNQLKSPSLNELKKILRNCIYGVDIEDKATQLTAFSLCIALCDELSPKQIWDELKFDNLISKNIFSRDFFLWKNTNELKFDIVIGNPPFIRGGVTKESGLTGTLSGKTIKIPFKQISVKFFIESFSLLKENGLMCMIGNSSSLLYNPSSLDFKTALFSQFNVVQIFDFTHLARNKTLWDNNDPATAAFFVENKEPDFNKNILHITFRRNKATKSRIYFEVDEYDFHFVNRTVAIENHFIWKNNLLGGGRIKQTIQKLQDNNTLEDFLKNHQKEYSLSWGEGDGKGIAPPDNFFGESGQHSLFGDDHEVPKSYYRAYNGVKAKEIFKAPLLLIHENIGVENNKIPLKLMDNDFPFFNEIIGIRSNNQGLLKRIYQEFQKWMNIYRFSIFCKSGKLLIYKNTACLMADIMDLPFDLDNALDLELSEIDMNVIRDVNTYMQDYLRHGEISNILKPIKADDFSVILDYGQEFSRALNIVYAEEPSKFRLSEIIKFSDNKFIAVVFSYDSLSDEAKTNSYIEILDLGNEKELMSSDVSSSLNTSRIIRIYRKNKVILIKPNQKKYWLNIFAYRDADKTFADISKLGY